ncbi:MAG: hypothetical protein N3I35_06685 [Clostridia bacterium]|nr:hypothetical protein [Clostridia bacterium]
MGLLDKLKKIGGDMLEKVKDKKEEYEKSAKVASMQNEFIEAKSKYDTEIMDEREWLYLGNKEVDRNINSSNKPTKKANNVINIIYEFIESQVDTTIPLPSVKAKRQGFSEQAQIIEDSIKSDLMESDIYRINDENERITPIQGISVITVDWNPDFIHHLYRGEIELNNKHPKCLIPEPGVYALQKMSKFWIMSSETKEFVKNRYGVDVSDEDEEYPEINSLNTDGNVSKQSAMLNSDTARLKGSGSPNDKVTVITKWYKDSKGKICKYTWCGNKELEDMPNFFARRLKRCAECNSVVYSGKCECGSKKIKTSIEEYEELNQDIALSDGTVIPAMSPKYDEYGQPEMEMVTDEMGMPVLDMIGQPQLRPVMEPTKIKYFCPTRYPVVVRKNVPAQFSFTGQSDVDIIRDQQDAIKKVVTKIERKIIDGGALVKLPEDPNIKISDEIYKVVRGTPDKLGQIGVENIEANIGQDITFMQQQYKAAQFTLGITDSYQGKPDATATSGKAKQLQIAQASGRMQSKAFNKRVAYKELFEIMFEFKLAFYDEIRPFLAKDEYGKDIYKEFNKYDFLEQDSSGEWFYNTDYIFDADVNGAMMNDKLWIREQAMELFASKAIDDMQLFTILESINFPMAKEIKRQKEEQRQQMQQQQALMQQQATQMMGVLPGGGGNIAPT